MSDDDDRRVGGPIPLSVATESVLFAGMIEEKLRNALMLGGTIALMYWLSTRKRSR